MDIPSNVEDSIKTIYFLAYLNGDVDKNKIKKIIQTIQSNNYLSSELKAKIVKKYRVSKYKIILEMLESIVERTNGKNLVNWLLDYAGLLLSYNTPNEKLRENTMQTLLQKVYTIS